MHIFLVVLHVILIVDILPGLVVVAFWYDKWANLLSFEKKDTFSRVVGIFFWFLVVRLLIVSKKQQPKKSDDGVKGKPKVLQKA